jgi:hypothetical protein
VTALTFSKLSELAKSKPPLRCHAVSLDEWEPGLETYIAELTAYERDQRIEMGWTAHKQAKNQEGNEGYVPWVVAACMCTSAGRDFMATADGIAALAEIVGGFDCKAVMKLFLKVQEVNGFDETQEEREKN